MNLTLSVIDPQTDNRWDEFVVKHPRGSIYHHSLWGKAVAETYGFRPFYISLENSQSGRIEGVLPLMKVNSKLTGKRLVSLPLTAYCPALFPESELENMIQFATTNCPDMDYIELKFLADVTNTNDLKGQSLYATHILELEPDSEKTFKKFHANCIRRKIKKAEKSGFTFRIADKEEDLKAFFKLETAVRKHHGLPPQPYSFFTNIWKNLKSHNLMFLPVLEYQNKIVAAVLMLRFNDTFYYEYSASDSRYWSLGPNQLIIWEIIKLAYKEGIRKFDFGRTALTNHSLLTFKQRWGAQQHILHYYYHPAIKKIKTNDNSGLARRLMHFTNRHLPSPLLQLEGKLLYPHLG